MSLLNEPIQVDCDDCNGRYMVDGTQIDPDENRGTTCPYCEAVNPHAIHIRTKYGVDR